MTTSFNRPAPFAVTLALFGAALQADTTFTFQDGANNYSGAQDVSINTQYAQYNGGNGWQWRGDAELGCYTVTPGAAVGVVLQSAAGNSVVVSVTAALGTAIAGPLNYTAPAIRARHVVTDLTPSAGYTVVVNLAGGNHSVSVVPGGNALASSVGVLTFQVSPSGQVTP
jgi:hypothetical protein